MTRSYNDLYLDLRRALKKSGTEAASLEARELICAASGKGRDVFFRDLQLYVPDFVQQRLDGFLARRLEGEPVAYLVGEWEFYGLTLTINPSVLIPRPDTELLVDRAVSHMEAAGEGGRVLDLCTGSGCVGLAIASRVKSCRAILVDASEEALLVARQNIRRNQLQGRVAALPGDATQEPDPSLWDFDVIACNPPYIPTRDMDTLDISVRGYEPHMALHGGLDGLDFYRHITKHWTAALRDGGTMLFEVGIGQAEPVRALMLEAGFTNIAFHRDGADILRVVEGQRPK